MTSNMIIFQNRKLKLHIHFIYTYINIVVHELQAENLIYKKNFYKNPITSMLGRAQKGINEFVNLVQVMIVHIILLSVNREEKSHSTR